jgi:hypothetical protein
MHFCPTCGTTVFWEADLRPDHIGVAVGAFHDASFPPPTGSIYEESKHGWVAFAHDFAHFPIGEADLAAKRFWQAEDQAQPATYEAKAGGAPVVSRAPFAANARGARTKPAAPARAAVVRNRRRACVFGIG